MKYVRRVHGMKIAFGLFLLSAACILPLAAQTVDGTSSADTITVGGSNISSDNTLTYDLNQGAGSETGTSTPDYSNFSGSPIVLDAKEGDDTITVSGTPTKSINIFGGLGSNTVTVQSGTILNGNIQGGSLPPTSSSDSKIEVFGTVLGDIGYANVTAGAEGQSATISGAIGTIDGADRLAHNVTLINSVVANTSGADAAIKASGAIVVIDSAVSGAIDNRDSVEGHGINIDLAGASDLYSRGPIVVQAAGSGGIDNSFSTTQAPIIITEAGTGNITSRGEIIVFQGGGSTFQNTQLIPDTDNPGIIISQGGNGTTISDGRVEVQNGGMGVIEATDVIIGTGATGTSITGRNLLVLDFVDKVTVQGAGTVSTADLGIGNDEFIIEDLDSANISSLIDGGLGDADTFSADGFDITDLGVIFNNPGVGLYFLSGSITEAIDSEKFENYELIDLDVSSSDALIYGQELVRIFFDTDFSGPLNDIQAYIDGVATTEAELAIFQLPTNTDETTVFTFTGNNPLSGEALTFELTAIPEPSVTYMLLATGIAVLMLRYGKR